MSCHRTIIRLSAVLAVVASAEGCGDGDSATAPPTPEPARPTTVTVSPATNELTALGATVQLSAEVHDQNARVMAGATMTWTSSASSVATVNASGLVTAAGNGTATITSSAGSASGSAVVTVIQSVVSVEVSPSSETIASGSTLQLTAEAFDENGNAVAGAEFSWESSDAAVATVDASGLVTAVAKGVVTITASAGNAQGTAEITVGPNLDRAALVALYEATDGPNWVNSENWLTAAPLGDWYGVDTDASGRVVRLDLAERWDSEAEEGIAHGLAGTIPPELGNLDGLTWLNLSGNALSGPIPPELGNLASLTTLGLDSNELTGPIPPWLGDLTSLTRLGLAHNELTGPIPPELGNLDGLTWLNLSGNALPGPIPPWLGDLTSLTRLGLHSNELTGPIPPELGNLDGLTWLNLSGNALSGPIPPWLGDLTSLTRLGLAHNELTGPIPPELGNLDGLTFLGLHSNELTGPIPPELGNLASLTTLGLYSNELTGPIPPELGDLTSLTRLNLDGNALSGPIPPELGDLSSLTYLDLDRNRLSGPIPPELGNLASLTTLGLYSNELTGPIPPELGDLASLTWLHLESNELTGPIPPELGNLASLTRLDLFDNRLTGPIPSELGHLASLQDLNLGFNSLTGPIPSELGDLSSLTYLDLEFNSLTGLIPESFLELDALRLFGFGSNAGLCVPNTTAFVTWLESIEAVSGPFCQSAVSLAPQSQAEFEQRFTGWTMNVCGLTCDEDDEYSYAAAFIGPGRWADNEGNESGPYVGDYEYRAEGANTGTLTIMFDPSEPREGPPIIPVELTFTSRTMGTFEWRVGDEWCVDFPDGRCEGRFGFVESAPDTTQPELVSVVVEESGDQITLTFDEDIYLTNNADDPFAITADGEHVSRTHRTRSENSDRPISHGGLHARHHPDTGPIRQSDSGGNGQI